MSLNFKTKTSDMKKFQMRMIMVLLTISSALCIMAEFKIIEKIPNMNLYIEILGFYTLCFITRLYITIKLEPKDLPWAFAATYIVSFWISFQEFRIYDKDVLTASVSSFFLGIAGVILCAFVCSRAEKLKKTF